MDVTITVEQIVILLLKLYIVQSYCRHFRQFHTPKFKDGPFLLRMAPAERHDLNPTEHLQDELQWRLCARPSRQYQYLTSEICY